MVCAAAAIALASGCRDSDRLTACFDLVCPLGTACSEAHGICVADEQIDACAGLDPDAPCSFPGVSEGRCLDGVCFSIGCGNFVIEGEEVCDDGNTRDGDGCSADCRSDERCGNGRVDDLVGERCDDGNNLDGDACQADCSLPECGDGILDPGEACDDANDIAGDGCNLQCTSDETCGNGVVDVAAGEECDDDNLDVGDGCGATCKIEACGNDIEDPGEVCDDGNTVSGDGCSATCLSKEVCGNGIIDPADETCDDGNARDHDGCSSACTVEAAVWTPVPSPMFAPRNEPAAVYDSHREVTVLFGGVVQSGPSGAVVNDTWEYDGSVWIRAAPEASPSPRSGSAIAYDPERRVVVLYGGQTAAGATFRDTWEYDGTTWVKTADTGPPPCFGAAMGYDATRGEMVMWGCDGIDTFAYDAGTWTPRATTGPLFRHFGSLVYHPGRGTLILTGGYFFDSSVFDFEGSYDTWEWDGTEWTELTGSFPTATGRAAYDPSSNRIVAFGGIDVQNATSVWDGAWTDLATTTVPPGRVDNAMVYDAGRNRIVIAAGDLFGIAANEGSRNDTWELVGDDWLEAATERAPSNRFSAGGVFDRRRGRILVHGGRLGDEPTPPFLLDTWELVGDVWRKLSDTGAPTDRTSQSPASMVYDTTADACLLVTGTTPTHTDTWTFDGRRWNGQAASGAFSAGNYAIAFDASRELTVMVNFGVTWEYDGGSWRKNTSATPLPTIRGHMAYDPVREVVVYVNGNTWEYDTTTSPADWVQVPLETPAHGLGSLAWHEARGTIVFFTGATAEGAAVPETWEYDGTAWTKHLFPIFPPVGQSATLIDDPIRDRVLLIGGADVLFDMWTLQWRSGSPEEDCDAPGDEDGDGFADCADPDCLDDPCSALGERCTAAGACECAGGASETHCGDAFDDDCDGLIDCADPDCSSTTRCTAEADCTGGGDEDGDGLANCADPGCLSVGFCEAIEVSCEDGEDNDGDGKTDCQDPNCYLAPCAAVTP